MKNYKSMDHFWMPFTANRAFKSAPRIIERAEGMWLFNDEGRKILDATAGLWCVNAGHGRKEIAEAVATQINTLDYTSPFNLGHDIGFEFAERLVQHTPDGLDHVFFTCSGSEAVESALKIALAYQNVRGKGSKFHFVGRDKGYHGVNFGGISVGGLTTNRKGFGPLLAAHHIPHTLDVERNAFSKGLPEYGIERADELEKLLQFHGSDSIAAVIVEPVSGAGGVILPPVGYLKRLREICTRHDVLLIFDEVITGWGRLGDSFGSIKFDVKPDMIVSAKGITNGVIPLGAVFTSTEIHDTIMNGAPDGQVELFHGYTYSAHPVACAAGLAVLDIYESEGLLKRGSGEIGTYWEESLHSLKGLPGIVDVRNCGLVGAVQFAAADGSLVGPTIMRRCYDLGMSLRAIGDTIALSPPLIIEKEHIDQIVETFTTISSEMF